jgi:2-alkyl-3-oxoalkanoate reductase
VLEADAASRIEGVVLRYGMLYGAATGSTQAMAAKLRRRRFPLPGGGPGTISWIHVADATTATVAALERGRPGEVYNVVDDEPVRWHDYTAELARSPTRRRRRHCRSGWPGWWRRSGRDC